MDKEHPYKELISKNNYKVINCKKCGYWHVYPMPSDQTLASFYERTYYETLGDNRTMTDKERDPDGFYTLQYQDRLRHLKKALPKYMPLEITDVGAGYGDFLRFMSAQGWRTQGIEPSKRVCATMKDRKKLGIICARVDDIASLQIEKSSVVTLNNVLEHVNRPRDILEMIRKKLMAKRGILSVIVPNDFNPLQLLLMRTALKGTGKDYYWVGPPAHLNFWSIAGIKRFLRSCGFKTVNCTVDFPMELFCLMGENYITNPEIGRQAHLKRVMFEKTLAEAGQHELKDKLFDRFSRLNIGRDVQVICVSERS